MCEQVVCEQVVCEQVVCEEATGAGGGGRDAEPKKQEPHTKMWGISQITDACEKRKVCR